VAVINSLHKPKIFENPSDSWTVNSISLDGDQSVDVGKLLEESPLYTLLAEIRYMIYDQFLKFKRFPDYESRP
jgi:hypothetical protein